MDSKLLFYEEEQDYTQCTLCPHNCRLSENKYGVCRVRTLKNNIPVAVNYGEVASMGIDPIEKKPLYHFKPSQNILSLGSFGCNMSCSFCQNYEISQNRPDTKYISVDELISILPTLNNNAGIAFTYNEPFMWYEYMYECAKKIKQINDDISIVIVTNGYVNEKPLEKILPYVDAMNIDLKGYTNRYYNKVCGADLEPVLKTIEKCNAKCHVEITTLLVSDENDSLDEVRNIAQFIANINEDIPLHLSRYFPRYKMENEATQIEKLLAAQKEALKYLKYVYIGNVPNVDTNTYCPQCNQLLIRRNSYHTEILIERNECPVCGAKLNIIL